MTCNLFAATSAELKILDEAITDYNIKVAPELPRAEVQRLDFSAKNEKSELLGGIQAYRVNWGILHVELIYVFEPYRHHRIASKLLQHVEQIARQHKCHLAHLDTFDFQAKDFYVQHGYSIFGTLENAPNGHRRYYMQKLLNRKTTDVLMREMKVDDIETLTRAQALYSHLGYVPDGYGITYKHLPVAAGKSYTVDDDLILWLIKSL